MSIFYIDKQAKLVLSGLLVAFFLLMMSGCVTLPDTEVAQTRTRQTVGQVTPSQSVAQTFTARRPNLNGVTLWFGAEDAAERVIVTLRESPTGPPLTVIPVTVSQLPRYGYGSTHVAFPPQPDSANGDYYLEISTQAGDVNILGRDEDAYPGGTAFLNAEPIPGDIAFRLTYAYTLSDFVGDLREAAPYLWLILPLGMILLLPGWLLLTWTKLDSHFDSGEQIALSVGLSLVIIPLLMLWTTVLNLAWTQTAVRVAGIMLLILGMMHLPKLKHPPSLSDIDLHAVALLGIFLLSLVVRLIMVRDMVVPAWVDPVHHSLITRFILQAGGFPESYAPHFPPDVNHYHIGFHSVLATFQWLTDLSLTKSMLILGQFLNALMIFAVYAFTTTLTEGKTAALVAALMTAIFTPMPAYYTAWGGRYTQLTGLLIFPIGLVWGKLAREGKKNHPWSLVFIASLTFGGLFLVHYRVTAFLGVILVVYALVEIFLPSIVEQESRLNIFYNLAKTLFPAGLLSIVLTLPWFLPTFSGLILPKSQAWSGEVTPLFADLRWHRFTIGLGSYTLVLAGLGLLWAFGCKKRFALTLTLWIGILFALANVGALALPGNSLINNTAVEISIFIPVSLLGGYFIQEVIGFCLSKVDRERKRLAQWGIGVLLLGASGFAVLRLLSLLDPSLVFFHAADLEAVTWIEENIPQEETIALNPAVWGYGLYYGEDGGSWISPLAGNLTMPPPGLYGLGAEKRLYVNQFVLAVQSTHHNPGELAQILTGYGVKYIYLGRHGGILSPALLQESEFFECVYEGEGTWVFEVVGVP